MAAAALNVSASVASSSADKFWPCRSACLGRVKEEDDEEEGAGAWGVGGGWTLSIFGGRLRDRRTAAALIRAARETASVSTVYTYPCQLSPAGERIKAAASPMDHGSTQTTKSAAPASTQCV